MASQTLAPDAILASTNLTGSVTDIDEAVDWTPLDFPSLTGWWDANDLSGQADGTDVTSWPDKSGAARHMVQRGANNLPSKETTSTYINVKFTRASSESLGISATLATMIGNTGYAAIVAEFATAALATAFGDVNAAGTDGGYFTIFVAGTPTNWQVVIFDTASRSRSFATTTNTKALITMRRDSGGTLYGSLNGAAETSTASAAASVQTNAMAMGATQTGANWFDGRIYEAVCSTSNGTATDQALMIDYLKAKWGIA